MYNMNAKYLLPFAALAFSMLAHAENPRLIFDTDITGDVDDVLALAMCHTLADRSACELLAVTISKHHPLTVSFVAAQNTFYGRPNLPIGATTDPKAQQRESKYLKLADSPDYPHNLRKNSEVKDAVLLLRELLQAQPDHRVTIVSVGIASNLANLLRSDGGVDLVARKVKTLSLMAGAFAYTNGTNYHREANVINGIESMQTVADLWPDEVPIVWSGYEIGESLPFPRVVIQRDLEYRSPHLVKEAYLLHCGPDHDRPCWDQSSVLWAVYPERGYFGLSRPGRVRVLEDGFTQFMPAQPGKGSQRDRFLTLNEPQRSRAMEAIIHLTIQPPVK
jgi:purine nucleosidase